MAGVSIAREAATGSSATAIILIGGSWWPATREATSTTVRLAAIRRQAGFDPPGRR